MRTEPARLGVISFDLVGMSPRCDERFSYECAPVSEHGKVGYSTL